MSDLLPVLVADLVDDAARAALEEVARAKEAVWVPLVAPPAVSSRHLLEVYTPSFQEPLRFIAEPVGPPGPRGFPLRLSALEAGAVPAPLVAPVEERAARLDTPTIIRAPSAGAPREGKPVRISAEHAAELGGAAPSDPNPAPESLVGRTLSGGKLELEELLGAGALGAVYRARHKQLFVTAAVKVLHEEFQHDVDFSRRFYSEALSASRLDHRNLVRVLDFGQEPDGLLYLAMEYLEGETLREHLAREGPLPAERVADIMLQVSAGLGHAHAHGLVHRDVRPENLRLVPVQDDDGNERLLVKVCDLGIALLRSTGSEERQRKLRPSPEYMSPEQCRNEELDARSDVYSCGIVLYELATGQVPFQAAKPIVVVNRHLSMPPTPLREIRPGVDGRLERIVQRALSKSREDRYADVRELRADLKVLLRKPTSGEIAAFDLAREAARVASSFPPSGPSSPRQRVRVSVPPPAVAPSFPPAPSFSLAPAPPAPAPEERSAYSYDAIPRAVPVTRTSSPPAGEVAPSLSPPPPRPASAPPKRPSDAPSWLEVRDEGMAKFLGHMGDQVIEELADTLSRDPTKWLAKLTTERDIRTFAKMLAELEIALRTLAARADARALFAASSTLDGLATEGTQGPGTRGARAAMMMRFFRDPGMLSPVAERLLAGDEEHWEAAQSLIRRAGVAGAYALYGARVKLAAQPAARAPFVTTMRTLGQAAWPVVRAALEKIPEGALTGSHPPAAQLAEDLLLSVPPSPDEAAGHAVLVFVRAKVPAVCRAGAIALARLWVDRARPVLTGLLADPDDGVCAAAIVGLRQIGALDQDLLRRLVTLARRAEPTSPELRAAVVTALEGAPRELKPLVMQLLAELVRAPADDAAVLSAARALLGMAGGEAGALVAERASRAAEPLRGHLMALVSAA